MDFPEIIRRYLDVKGWKQADLCRATGIPSAVISELFSDRDKARKSLGYGNVALIAKNTDINPHFLLTGEGDEIKPDSPAANFPRNEVIKATVLVRDLTASGLTPEEEGRLIAVIAELLARGQSEEQIRVRLMSQAAQSLAALLRPE